MSEQEWIDCFGDNLLEIMRDRGFNVEMLADETNISRMTIYRYLKKKSMPNIKNIIKIAYAVGCSFDKLLDFGETIID